MERIKGGGAWNGGGKSGNGLRPDKSQEEGRGGALKVGGWAGGRGRERSRSAESTTSQGGWHFEAAASAEGEKQR